MKKSNPLVSVIITTYNRYELLKIALQKVYEQSYHSIEVIVSDDCSTDNTPLIVNDFPAIRYVQTPHNMGYAQNSKFALSHAKGDYVIVLSDDDTFCDSLFLEKAVEAFVHDSAVDMVISKTQIQTSTHIVLHPYPFQETYSSEAFFLWWMEVRSNFSDYFSLSSILFKRELLVKIDAFSSMFEASSTIDAYVIFAAAALARKIRFLDIVGYTWRFPEENTLSNANRDDLVKQAQYNLAFVFDMDRFVAKHALDESLKQTIKQALNQRVEWVFNAILSEKERIKNNEKFEKILSCLDATKDIYIYGRGWTGLSLQAFLGEHGVQVKAFIDDFKVHFDDTIDFETFAGIDADKNVVISSYKYQDTYFIYKKLSRCSKTNIYALLDV